MRFYLWGLSFKFRWHQRMNPTPSRNAAVPSASYSGTAFLLRDFHFRCPCTSRVLGAVWLKAAVSSQKDGQTWRAFSCWIVGSEFSKTFGVPKQTAIYCNPCSRTPKGGPLALGNSWIGVGSSKPGQPVSKRGEGC